MGEEGASSEQEMRFSTRQSLEPFQESFIDAFCAELVDEVIVVDCHLFSQCEEKENRKNVRGKRRNGEGKSSTLVFRTRKGMKDDGN